MDVIFLDTETTGFKNCRLVELAYAHTLLDTLEFPKVVSFRTKPPIPIEEGALKVHGISEEMLAEEIPFQEREDYEELKSLIEGAIVIAHNASFDIGVLMREGINVGNYIDTQKLARLVYPKAPSHKLQDLRTHLEIDIEGLAHSAAGDVAVLMAVFHKMREEKGGEWDYVIIDAIKVYNS